MKKIILILFIIVAASVQVKAQDWFEGFETSDSLHLPAGWSVWNEAGFPIQEFSNWTVRDSGLGLPGLATATSKAHTGIKACGVSWYACLDTNGVSTKDISDAWLVSKKIHVWSTSALVSYWVALGSPTYLDSLQIWVSTVDSTPNSFTHFIETLSNRGPYGVFNQNFLPLADYVGQDIWIGFRYNMDAAFDGFFVHLDDVDVSNPIGIHQIGTETPFKFELKQNYPNPFNPTTNIEFDIAKTSSVRLVVYNSIGQEVAILVDSELKAGTYKYDFTASYLPSGTYFYRLTADNYTKTNKMILVK